MVEIAVGAGATATTLAAHEAILVKSPWFAERCAALTGKVRALSCLAIPSHGLTTTAARH